MPLLHVVSLMGLPMNGKGGYASAPPKKTPFPFSVSFAFAPIRMPTGRPPTDALVGDFLVPVYESLGQYSEGMACESDGDTVALWHSLGHHRPADGSVRPAAIRGSA
jgi:hypothetical protein